MQASKSSSSECGTAYQTISSADIAFTVQSRHQRIIGTLEYRHPSTVNAMLKVLDYGDVRVSSDGRTIRVEDPTQREPEEMPWSLQNLRRMVAANLEVISLWDSQRQLSTGTGGNMAGADLNLVWRTTATRQDGTIFYDGIVEKLRVTSRHNPPRARAKD